MTPRPYLSFSQMVLFEMSPKRYAEQYLYDKKQFVNRNMAFGTLMADGLENDEATGNATLDLMIAGIPKFELMDIAFQVPLKDGKNTIMILAKPDTAKADYSAFKEYKTSVRPWKQKMADDSGQITFYATAMWLKTKKIPKDIELVDVVVEYLEDGSLQPTGEMLRFPTERTMVDIIKMTARMKRAYRGISKLCEDELL